jgi:hypothetical protein
MFQVAAFSSNARVSRCTSTVPLFGSFGPKL